MTEQLPYQDPTLPVEARVEDLLGRMSLAEKAGQLFHAPAMVGPDGAFDLDQRAFHWPPLRELLARHISHFNLVGSADAEQLAAWSYALQAHAAEQHHGIPVTLSSDPRHSLSRRGPVTRKRRSTNRASGCATSRLAREAPKPPGTGQGTAGDLINRPCRHVCA